LLKNFDAKHQNITALMQVKSDKSLINARKVATDHLHVKLGVLYKEQESIDGRIKSLSIGGHPF
jgi:type II secretory pathway component PulL